MLKKLTEPAITVEAPFEHDVLGRESSIKKLTQLVESTEQPFVLSIEAPWGWGKTTFIRMWKAYLESKGHTCLLFNAWQNDFVDDPLVAFVGEMAAYFENEKQGLCKNASVKKHLGAVKRIGAGILRKGLPIAVQVVTQGLLNQKAVTEAVGEFANSGDKVADFASDLAKERLDKYEAEKSGIGAFRMNLEKLTNEIATKKAGVSPLVFFIDEMDRCRPDFAIALLERIKHLFNVNRVIFVLAVDRTQLNESVKSLYGLNTNPDGYLRRFIDLAYSLPPPSTEQFVESLYRRFAMDECFEKLNNGLRVAEIWKSVFVNCATALALGLRTQEQCFTEMNIVWRTNSGHRAICSQVLAFFSALRAHRPGVIQELRQRKISIDSVNDLFASIKDSIHKVWIEAALIAVSYDSREERHERFKILKEKYSKPEENPSYLVYSPARLVNDFGNDGYSNEILYTLSLLEMSDQFH